MSEKIKNFFKTNIYLKLGSVACALILWMTVINLTDPVEEKTVLRVPVEVLHDEAITSTGRVYHVTENSSVNVVCSAKKTDLNSIRAADFYAYADMRYSYGQSDDEKAAKINLQIADGSVNKDKIKEFRIASSDVMYFTTEDIITRSYAIEVIQTGELAPGNALEGILVSNPGTVEVTGPESAFANVSKAAVTVDISGFSSEVDTLTGTVELYDGNGKPITNENLTLNITDVEVSAEVLRTKTVDIAVAGVSGIPANGFIYSGKTIDLESITVAGLRADMAAFDVVTIPAEALNIEGASENMVFEVDITSYLPENIRVLNGTTTVLVTIHIEEIKTKSVKIPSSKMIIEGEKEGLIYDLADNCTVTVKGLQEDLDALDEEDIVLHLSVAGLEVGEYTLNVEVQLPAGYSLSEDTVIQVVVTEETQEETSSEETPEIGTSGEAVSPARMSLFDN